MSIVSSAYQGPSLYPTTQAVPSSQQVVIPQITIPQPLTSYVSQMPQTGSMVQANAMTQPDSPLKVKGLDGAKAYPTKPNGMYALFDENEDVFYVKVTDQNNYPVSLKRYRFYEEEEPAVPEPPQYVTMEEFEKFKEEMLNAKQPVRVKNGRTKSDDESVSESADK